jgi:TPR repeat protein
MAKTGNKIARERAGRGDTEAMIVLYLANQGLAWLEKAAEAGDGFGQYLLASVYKVAKVGFLSLAAVRKLLGNGLRHQRRTVFRRECIYIQTSYMNMGAVRPMSDTGLRKLLRQDILKLW